MREKVHYMGAKRDGEQDKVGAGRGMREGTRFKSYSSKLTTKRETYKYLTKKNEILPYSL